MKPRENPYAPILKEIEMGLWEHDFRVDEGAEPYTYDDEATRACLKIFMSAMLWKLWDNKDGKNIEDKVRLVEEMGNDIKNLIMKYTGIDTHKLYSRGD